MGLTKGTSMKAFLIFALLLSAAFMANGASANPYIGQPYIAKANQCTAAGHVKEQTQKALQEVFLKVGRINDQLIYRQISLKQYDQQLRQNIEQIAANYPEVFQDGREFLKAADKYRQELLQINGRLNEYVNSLQYKQDIDFATRNFLQEVALILPL